jgi:hypothetical protein
MALDEGGSRDRLAHLLPLFWKAVTGGVQDYYEKYQDTANVHRPTTMRSIVRDHIVDRLRELIVDTVVDVQILDSNQTTYFDCCAQFRILVKKSDEFGIVELAKTQDSFDFQCNNQQLIFDTSVIPEVTNLYLSYVPNSNDPTAPSVFLICPKQGGYLWRIEIEPPAADIMPIPLSSGPPPSGDDQDLVRLPAEEKPSE